ncbi:DNA topoisomerase 3 [Photobacterium leiognathi]|uniref:DNA topoisomerase 3 n=1 Tax=Photobacterium leiognathi TaxID=553611 RepID=UPI00298118E8|nr:DNA topoisomerase 3 [Photobacterium leiognathi]
MKPLYIAEKPELARAIVNGIGKNPKKNNGFIECENVTVTWCFGHLLESQMPEEINPEYGKWDINHLPMRLMPVPIKPNPKSAAQLRTIQKLLKGRDKVINAGDPDQEGQRLVDEVLEYSNYNGYVERVLINDFNKAAVVKAVQSQRPNKEFFPISMAAKARSVFDFVYGMNLTRVCTLVARDEGYDGMLTVGRVQTAIIGMVVLRYRANKNHTKTPFYDIYIISNYDDQEYRFKFSPSKQIVDKYSDKFDEKNRIIDKNFAEQLLALIQRAGVAEITTIEHKTGKVQPPLPFSLMGLQREASSILGLSPEQTLKVTQTLREKHQLITYNRTDCSYLPEEHLAQAPQLINVIGRLLPELAPHISNANPSQKSKAFNTKKIEAHHAISPTENSHADLSALSDTEKNIYMLICRKYLAQFLPMCEQAKSKVELTVANAFTFKANHTTELKAGWKNLFRLKGDEIEEDEDDKDNDAGGKNGDLTKLNKGQNLNIATTNLSEGFTSAPALYTMATLLTDMNNAAKYVHNPRLKEILLERDKDSQQNGGIGTPATQAGILEGLFKRGYFKLNKKQIVPTSVGEDFYDALPSFATQVDLTAYWQEQMNLVEKGKISFEVFQERVDQFVTKAVFDIKQNGLNIKSASRVHYDCPKCGKKLRFLANKKIWTCTGYPECKALYPDQAKRPDFNAKPKAAAEETNFDCPKCGKHKLKKRKTSTGNEWYGCGGYPECKASFKLVEGKLEPLEFKKKTGRKSSKKSTK